MKIVEGRFKFDFNRQKLSISISKENRKTLSLIAHYRSINPRQCANEMFANILADEVERMEKLLGEEWKNKIKENP